MREMLTTIGKLVSTDQCSGQPASKLAIVGKTRKVYESQRLLLDLNCVLKHLLANANKSANNLTRAIPRSSDSGRARTHDIRTINSLPLLDDADASDFDSNFRPVF